VSRHHKVAVAQVWITPYARLKLTPQAMQFEKKSLFGKNFIATVATAFISAFAVNLASAQGSALLAGVAKINLTPPLEMKAALGGYGERENKPAVGVHDAIWAKALLLTRGEQKFVIITADVLGFPPKFKPSILKRLSSEGWEANRIMLLPSHSHTSLDLMALHPDNVFDNKRVGLFHKELFEHTADQLTQLIRASGKNLTPILAGSTNMTVPNRNRNRRRGLTAHDTTLTVTRIDTTTGTPLAVLVNWTAHPTFMDENDMLFSGDWPGHLQRTVEALIGHGALTLYYNGAEGDQSPVPPADCDSHWERAERYGREMGILSWRLWETIKPAEVTRFSYHTESIDLPKRQWHPDFMKTGGAEYGLDETKMQGFLDQLNPTRTHSTCLRLGELEILGVPGEMAAQLGMDIKSKARKLSGAKYPTIGGLADEWVSYILSAEEYRKGGYEASMSFYGEALGDTMLKGVVRPAKAMQKK
jgi:neutral ceramidase